MYNYKSRFICDKSFKHIYMYIIIIYEYTYMHIHNTYDVQ